MVQRWIKVIGQGWAKVLTMFAPPITGKSEVAPNIPFNNHDSRSLPPWVATKTCKPQTHPRPAWRKCNSHWTKKFCSKFHCSKQYNYQTVEIQKFPNLGLRQKREGKAYAQFTRSNSRHQREQSILSIKKRFWKLSPFEPLSINLKP